jgi:hypothetical protein
MPNDSRSRRDKKEKEKKRKDKKDPKPLHKELPADEAEAASIDVDGIHSEEALAFSVSLLGAKPSSKAMENSLSLPLPLCPLQQKGKIRQRGRRATLSLKKTAKMEAPSLMTAKR